MAKIRKVSSISKEFDGKEIQGKLIERSGLLGSKVKKEVFKFPTGGRHVEKTITNKKGNVIYRLSKDTKLNPFKKSEPIKKKFDDGGLTGKQNRLARQEKRVYNKYTDAKTSGNTEKSDKLYDKLIDKQTKSIKAGVNVQYKTGGTTKATKFAALAPPYDKATAADRIAGAKKNARKKK